MCCSRCICSLDVAFVLLTLYWAWWALLLVNVVLFVAWTYYYDTNPHILIFFNKEYSIFPNLQCASCWFPFIVSPLHLLPLLWPIDWFSWLFSSWDLSELIRGHLFPSSRHLKVQCAFPTVPITLDLPHLREKLDPFPMCLAARST